MIKLELSYMDKLEIAQDIQQAILLINRRMRQLRSYPHESAQESADQLNIAIDHLQCVRDEYSSGLNMTFEKIQRGE